LVITILVPSVIGKVGSARAAAADKRVKKFTADWKTTLSLFSVFNLAMIVWQSLSGARDNLFDQQYVFKMPLAERIATGVMSSQKSAPVAVTVISYLSSNISQQGLLIIPCVSGPARQSPPGLFALPALTGQWWGQIAQIFIGSALAKYFARQVKREQMLAAAAAPDPSSEAPGATDAGGGDGLTLAHATSSDGGKPPPAVLACSA
ncbi:hypothetical protein ABPG77_009192, partial [Micractinium sp. CCAP 211/92]